MNKKMNSEKLSKVSFWTGIGGIFASFPMNLIAVIAGYKSEERLTPSDTSRTVSRGRIGRTLGIISIALNVLVMSAYMVAKERGNKS